MVRELNYRVTIPNNVLNSGIDNSIGTFGKGPGYVGDSCRKCEANSVGVEGTPVIFLLGWYGSRYQDLAKYSAIYHSRSYITIAYTHNYRSGGKLKDVAMKVLESFFQLGLERNPIFFHLFSGGAGYIYRHVTDTVNGSNPGKFGSLDIRGIVLDSIPGRIDPTSVYRSWLAMMPASQPRIVNATLSYLLATLFRIIMVVQRSHQDKLKAYYRAMVEDRMACPHLFLYSKADDIASYTDIQAAITGRRRRGLKVREVLWEDSDHVRHLQKHREEYANSYLNFVEDCLKGQNGEGFEGSHSDHLGTLKKSKL